MEPANDHEFVPRIEELVEIGLQLLELLVERRDVPPNRFEPPVAGLLIHDSAGHMPLGIGIETRKESLAVSPVEGLFPLPHDVHVPLRHRPRSIRNGPNSLPSLRPAREALPLPLVPAS